MDTITRMHNFSLMLIERLVQNVGTFRYGRAFEDPDLRDVWDNNFLLVEATEVEAGALNAEADEVQAHLRHRKLVILDTENGRRLEPGLVDAGYSCSRLVWMDLAGPSSDDGPCAESLAEIDAEPSLRAFYGPTAGDPRGKVMGQLVERARRMSHVTEVRRFGVREGGDVASVCDLYFEAGTAQIEDVKTLEPFRRRGFARQVVGRAISEARQGGADLIFLIAEADDWPADLYRRMGFVDRTISYEFSRPLP